MSFAARTIAASGVVSSTKYTGTITQAFYYDGSFASYYGFDTGVTTGVAFGSRSPTTVSGYTFETCYDLYLGSTPYNGYLVISGFGADPGIDFITSLTIGSSQQFPSPSGYYYAGGSASWTFPTVFGFNSIGTIACTMTGI